MDFVGTGVWMKRMKNTGTRNNESALFSSQKILQNFLDSMSHRIFRRMYGALNIDKNKN